MLAGERRHANAVAVTPTSVLVLTRESIKAQTSFHPVIASKLFLNLAVDVSKRWVKFIAKLHEEGNNRAGRRRKTMQRVDKLDFEPEYGVSVQSIEGHDITAYEL